MKKGTTSHEIIAMHIQSDKIMEKATTQGDVKTHNREFMKRDKIHQFLAVRPDLAKEVYQELFEHECIVSRLSAAAQCLKNGLFIEKAEDILIMMEKDNSAGVYSLEAHMTLRVWRGEFPGKKL